MLAVDFTSAKFRLQLEDSNHRQAFKRLPEPAGVFRRQALAAGDGCIGPLIGSYVVLAPSMQACSGRPVASGRDTCGPRAAAAVGTA